MKLLYTPTSPFARKVRVFLRERSAAFSIEELVRVPLDEPVGLRAANPLGKIPVLLTDTTSVLDSPVIIEYLDSTLPGASLLPAAGAERWEVLRRQALADGMMDAALSLTFEQRREDASISRFWCDRWRLAVMEGVRALEQDAAELPGFPDIGAIAIATALEYIDFRQSDLRWREQAPDLVKWLGGLSDRPSMVETRPS